MGVPAGNPSLHRPLRPALAPVSLDHESDVVRNFSIAMGGPFYDFLRRHGLLRSTLPNIVRRIVAIVALVWLPLLPLALMEGMAWGHKVTIPFLYDFAVYGRFLLALPLLLLAEVVIDPAIRLVVAEFVDSGIVPDTELPAFERLLRKLQRLRNSGISELIIFLLAFLPLSLIEAAWTPGAIRTWHTTPLGYTAAGWWFVLFSAPFFRFIIYRWVFRYALWSMLLWRTSKLRLVLIPSHPDHCGGLGFLTVAQRRFGILFCALGCVFAGRMANSMAFEGGSVKSYKALMIGFVVLALLAGLLPLLLLAPKLSKVRRVGLIEYGRLANDYTEAFDRKWVHYSEPPGEPLLGSADIQSLADLGNSYALVDAIKIAPVSKRLILQLGFQAAAPLIPMIIIGTPTAELVQAVTKMVM